jgi:hypothetical protein
MMFKVKLALPTDFDPTMADLAIMNAIINHGGVSLPLYAITCNNTNQYLHASCDAADLTSSLSL